MSLAGDPPGGSFANCMAYTTGYSWQYQSYGEFDPDL
jgi:hypothetical protein